MVERDPHHVVLCLADISVPVTEEYGSTSQSLSWICQLSSEAQPPRRAVLVSGLISHRHCRYCPQTPVERLDTLCSWTREWLHVFLGVLSG